MRSYQFMNKYIRIRMAQWLFGLLVPAFASLATNIYFARYLQKYSSQFIEGLASLTEIISMLIFMLIVLLLLSCIDDLGRYVFSQFIANTENEIKYDCYHGLIHASMQDIEEYNKGELIARYHTDTEKSARLVANDLQGVIYPIVVGVGYFLAVMAYDVLVGLIMMALGVGVIVINFLFIKKIRKIQTKILFANEAYTLDCDNLIRGKISVRQYAAGEIMKERIASSAHAVCEKERLELQLQVVKSLLSDGLTNVCMYVLPALACVLAAYGYISVPSVFFIYQICRFFIIYMQNFSTAVINYSIDTLSFKKIKTLLLLEDEAYRKKNISDNILSSKCGIEFKQVKVYYGEHLILKNISFEIHPGEIVGLVGESGSGKSTLMKALLHMTEYTGTIYLGGYDCAMIPLEELRRQIAIVPEHSELFNLDVRMNILYGNKNRTEKKIDTVKAMAGISDNDCVMLREIGENGCQLSGGQRQKVAIARALYKNSPIMVFDEPTASLDASSEGIFLNTLSILKAEGKCIILISHKPTTLKIADRIMEIKDGEVREL